MALSEEQLRPNNRWKRMVIEYKTSLTEQQWSVIDSCTQTGNLTVLNRFLCQEQFNSHGTGPNRIFRRLLAAAPLCFESKEEVECYGEESSDLSDQCAQLDDEPSSTSKRADRPETFEPSPSLTKRRK